MQNIIVVYLISALKGGEGPNLAFIYKDGTTLPKLGEFVYFGDPSVKFLISAREHLYQDDKTVRIIYRLGDPQEVRKNEERCLRAPLTLFNNMD
jgi:hypothetical protein